MLKSFKYLNSTFFFFKCLFSVVNVLNCFSKLERISTLRIKRAKQIEIGEIHFYNTFGFNVLLALKFMNFENVALTQIIHFYVIKNRNA